jgi:uncharacterized protein
MTQRITLVDALRGFALLGIILVHSVEHFDFFYPPEVNFLFPAKLDRAIFDLSFFMIAGKAYSIFALLFGLSFYIQMERQAQRGTNFSRRFLWRLMVLMGMGFIHSLFYEGDILHIYALLGLPLVFLNRLGTKTLTLLALLLALQIPMLSQLSYAFIHPDYEHVETFGAGLWSVGAKVFATGNLREVMSYNIWTGRSAVWGWTFYNGRYLQLLGLFILGLVLGRKKTFEQLALNKKLFIRTILICGALALILTLIKSQIDFHALSKTQGQLIRKLIQSYTALSVTFVIIGSFSLLYQKATNWKFFNHLATYGRMSLSNYVFQSIVGVTLFYNFGFGLFRYMGSTWSLLYGALFFTLQVIISHYWMQRYYYGPLEWLWRAITFFDFSLKFKRLSNTNLNS